MRIVRALVFLSALALALWALAALLTGDLLAPVRHGLYVAPVILLGAGALCVLALLVRAWISAALAGLVALGLAATFSATLLRGAPDEAALTAPGTLRVLSLSNRKSNTDFETTARMLRENPADIIALQEVADGPALIALVQNLYGGADTPLHLCQFETELILSRYPVSLPLSGTRHWQLLCEVETPQGAVLVGSIHLPKARLKTRAQNDAVADLLEQVAAHDGPVILAGDFNTTPLTTPYRALSQAMSNAFDAAGRGFGHTFPTPARPLLGKLGGFLRIDHIFYTAPFEALSAAPLADHPPLADHFPVQATLRRQSE